MYRENREREGRCCQGRAMGAQRCRSQRASTVRLLNGLVVLFWGFWHIWGSFALGHLMLLSKNEKYRLVTSLPVSHNVGVISTTRQHNTYSCYKRYISTTRSTKYTTTWHEDALLESFNFQSFDVFASPLKPIPSEPASANYGAINHSSALSE